MSDDGASSDGSAAGPSLPAGVLRTRTAWEGDQLEMDHTRDRMRAAADADADDPDHNPTSSGAASGGPGSAGKAYAAVDLSQFQNTEVGRGYQAKHVVRQRSAAGAGKPMEIRDMSQREEKRGGADRKAADDITSRSKRKGKDRNKEERNGGAKKRTREQRSEQRPPSRAEKYLRCKGIRDFRREIEKILSSS